MSGKVLSYAPHANVNGVFKVMITS
jgi:hypothetical protein